MCIDGTLAQQAAWVSTAVRGFGLREGDLTRRLGAEVTAARGMVAEGYAAWEEQLPAAVDAVLAGSSPRRRPGTRNAHSSTQGTTRGLQSQSHGSSGKPALWLPGMGADDIDWAAHMTMYKVRPHDGHVFRALFVVQMAHDYHPAIQSSRKL